MIAAIAHPPRPLPRLPLLCALALLFAVAAPHVGLGEGAEPEVAPEAPGCVGCHHGDVEPAPQGLGAESRRSIAQLTRFVP